MRAFTAVLPPPEAVEHLDDFLSIRRDAAAFRWSDEFHVTLAFFADVLDHTIDELTERLAGIASRHQPMEARIAGGGAFPHPDRAKVLWAGLEIADTESLKRLAASARAAGSAVGAPPDGTRFSPHLTVARMGRPQQVSNWVRLLDSYAGPEFTIDRISLVASYLGEGRRRRPRYETLADLPLR